ncbi:MAG: F0F1 ATP synthase subunit delta [Chitinophagales bacterium]
MSSETNGDQREGCPPEPPAVRVVLAAEVSQELKEALADRVRRAAGPHARINWEIDPYLYGGVVIHLPDRVLDFSLAQQFRTYGRTVQQAIGQELVHLSAKAHSGWPLEPEAAAPAERR